MVKARIEASPTPSPTVSRRSATDDDREFLYALFCDCLPPKNGFDALPPAERDALLRMQFDARERLYRLDYGLADFELLLIDGTPVGKLYVDRGSQEYTLIDISLLPKYRDQGVGTQVVSELLEEARRLALPVRAFVQDHNLAWGLWKRLGFELSGDDGGYYEIVARTV